MDAQERLSQARQLHQQGNLDDALVEYKAVLAADPDNADAHHCLGALVLIKLGVAEINQALDHLKTAVRLDPAEAKFRHSLGKAYEAVEQWQAALSHYQFAVDKDPFTTLYQMSMVKPLTRLRRLTRVVEVCRSVLALEPAHPRANFKCASALRQLRREAEALVHYRRHLAHSPDDEQAAFWIAVLSGEAVARMPAGHVSALFDFYAPKFEEHLVQSLQYCTPEALARVLHEAAALPEARRDGGGDTGGRQQLGCCADLGCGTGLMGPLLRGHVSALDGVDLSAKMVAKARAKGVYDRLFVEDAVNFLSEQRGRGSGYDLLVAADVLVYIGDLAPLLAAAAGVSRTGTLFACSTECATEADRTARVAPRQNGNAAASHTSAPELAAGSSDASRPKVASDDVPGGAATVVAEADEGAGAREAPGYSCSITGRFRHDTEYVQQVAAAQGWRLLKHEQARIRCNAGEPVLGDLFVLVA